MPDWNLFLCSPCILRCVSFAIFFSDSLILLRGRWLSSAQNVLLAPSSPFVRQLGALIFSLPFRQLVAFSVIHSMLLDSSAVPMLRMFLFPSPLVVQPPPLSMWSIVFVLQNLNFPCILFLNQLGALFPPLVPDLDIFFV